MMDSDNEDFQEYNDDDDLEDTPLAAAGDAAPKKKRAKRAKKDPNKPKGAMSAYMCFAAHVRDEIVKQNPGIGVTQVAKIIGAKWRELDEDAKEPFKQQSERDKERFRQEMESYVPNPEFDSGKKRRKKKDPNAPKKPLSAYFLYADTRRAAIREANPELKVSEIAKQIGAEWKNLPEAQKQPFQARAEKLKQEYLLAKAEYEANN
jgi:hypothetical protein